jgi:hypothetical protein
LRVELGEVPYFLQVILHVGDSFHHGGSEGAQEARSEDPWGSRSLVRGPWRCIR